MDLLKIINDQVNEIVNKGQGIGLGSVIKHIERAETFLSKGELENDEQFYTDVIYRTNQAYEGILKESFSILTGNDGKRKTPNEIEKHFKENDILRERVLELFTNYRQNWRNKSTHNHDLFFSYSEALLAIVSISSFIHVLLIQIQEKISFNQEKVALESKKIEILKLIPDYNKLSLLKKISSLLDLFAKQSIKFIYNSKEIELLGALSAFFERYDKSLIIAREPKIGKYLRPDFIIQNDSEKLVLEIKKNIKVKETVTNQIVGYLEESKIKDGIVFYVDPSSKPIVNRLNMTFKSPRSKMDHNVYSVWATE
jgi:HEPN domain-containing protein